MKGLSMFSSAGIAETYLKNNNIDIVVASELIEKRCKVHSWLYKDCEMVCGDITNENVFNNVKNLQYCSLKKCLSNCHSGVNSHTHKTRIYINQDMRT